MSQLKNYLKGVGDIVDKTILILATLDTKGKEAGFLAENIWKLGKKPIIIDVGELGLPEIKADISREEVAEAGGISLKEFFKDTKNKKAAPVMAKGAIKIVSDLVKNNKAHGIISLGGTKGTSLATEVMRTIKYGFPKIMVSTMASSDVSVFIDISDIIMFPSVSDVLGLNPFLKRVLLNAASAICAMAQNTGDIIIEKGLLIGISNVGITTPGAMKAIALFQEAGYETIVFHAVGTGGRAMEQMIKEGIIGAVFDYALVEISNYLYGGLNNGGPYRLTAAGKAGIPQVICPGGVEVFALWIKEGEALPDQYKGRTEIRHSSLITTLRFNKKELINTAREVVERLKYTKDEAVFMIPTGAYSIYSKKGTPFYDPDADKAFADYIKENLPRNFKIIEIDADLTDEVFVAAAVKQMIELINKKKKA